MKDIYELGLTEDMRDRLGEQIKEWRQNKIVLSLAKVEDFNCEDLDL